MTIMAGVRRRTVSVLFVDIVGYTTMVDGLDCAEVHSLQMDYFTHVAAVVRQHGGIVEKYVGDAVMAVFGLSSRRPEGGAAAAVGCGLGIQETLMGVRLAGRHAISTRVGVATGEVMVDEAAARDGGFGMVSGSVVATAARLQAYAPHDTVVVDGPTQSLSHGNVAYQELPPAVLAGRAEAIDLFRALSQDVRTCVLAHQQ